MKENPTMSRLELTLERKWPKETYTIGVLSVNSNRFCETVEDTDRGLTSDMPSNKIKRIKVYRKTAIPKGTYRIDMDTVSSKFGSRVWARKYGGIVPRILGVPCFGGVLIHPGNTADDTLGCILVGQNKIKGGVVRSVETYYKLMDDYLVPASVRGEEIWITIQ